MTVGVSGSGKTTWAKSVVAADGNCVNINKDDLREMLHNSVHSKGRESLVIKVQEAIVGLAIESGNDVIISDTNLNPDNIERIKNKFSDKADVVIKDFTDVPLKTCIDRDSKRSKPVGEKVIKDQYRRYIKKEPNVLEQDKTLPKAIIFDIDGTLAHMTDRKPYEWNKVGEDLVDEELAQMARDMYLLGNWILIVSGRDEVCRKETTEWLNKNKIPYNALFMRQEGDNRRDSIIKKEIFFNYIQPNWYVRFVFDDRDQVVNEAWREIGIKCYQVAEGDF